MRNSVCIECFPLWFVCDSASLVHILWYDSRFRSWGRHFHEVKVSFLDCFGMYIFIFTVSDCSIFGNLMSYRPTDDMENFHSSVCKYTWSNILQTAVLHSWCPVNQQLAHHILIEVMFPCRLVHLLVLCNWFFFHRKLSIKSKLVMLVSLNYQAHNYDRLCW